MKSFRFPLQPIRVLREQKEHDAQLRYARAQRACEEAAERVQRTRDELESCWAALRDHTKGEVSVITLLRMRAWGNMLEQRLKEHQALLEAARAALQGVWNDLLLATRDRETLDRFHDRCRRAYDLQTRRAEQKELDELALRGRSGLRLSEALELEFS